MQHQHDASQDVSQADAVSLIVEWWQDGCPESRQSHLVNASGSEGASVLRQVHQLIEGSILLDATGRTAEEVHAEMLHALGVDVSPRKRWNWRRALHAAADGRLVLIANTHRAGRTRRSFEQKRLLSQLNNGGAGVVLHVTAALLPRSAKVIFKLRDQNRTQELWPPAIQALALAEPRTVPLRMWAELATAFSGETATEAELSRLLHDHSAQLASGDAGVTFVDEGLAEALRRDTRPEDFGRVNRHMTAWLRKASADFRHPEGWSESGPEGLYAATGLAMHAVQAGRFDRLPTGDGDPMSHFEDLLSDGSVLANLPQTVMMDAAGCAFPGSVHGNSAAADAVYLWSYGVVPAAQSEWAAWMHLTATARDDHAFADAVAGSGVHLPWKAEWVRWRPPGGYHPRYLQPGRVDALAEVRWEGRPAVAGLYSFTNDAAIWDAATGELLAGPWQGNDIPEEYRAGLSWPGESGGDRPDPVTFDDLHLAVPDEESVHELLLYSPALPVGDKVILGGPGGLLAIAPAERKPFSGLRSPNVAPFSGPYTASNETTPQDAPPPSPADLIEIYGAEKIRAFGEDELPAGLTNDATRRTLIDFGLPEMRESGMGIFPWGDHAEEVLTEVPWPSDIEPSAESGPFLQIGWWMGGRLVIDGPTGHLLRIPTEPDEDHLEGLPAACSLENFLTMVALWITGLRIRRTIEELDEAFMLPQHVYGAHLLIDEAGASAAAWSYVFYNE